MKKSVKILAVVVSLLTMFALVGCDQSNELAEYKTAAKTELETYVQERQGNYTTEDWAAISGFVEDGKAAVDMATDKAQVDSAVTMTKQAIDEVPPKEESVGALYSLQEAYDQGWLSQDALKSILYFAIYEEGLLSKDELKILLFAAYDIDDENFENFAPILKDPDILSAEIGLTIKEARANDLRTRITSPILEATADGITIVGYYGIYNGCVAVRLDDAYTVYPAIVGVMDVRGTLLIWKEN